MPVRDAVDAIDRSLPDERSLELHESCPNCGALLRGPYCSWCGQRQQEGDLTLGEFLHEVARDFSHWDSKIPRTLKTLFLEPGRLTLDVLAGRRARWIAPLRLYLICSLLYFLARPVEEAIQHRARRANAELFITAPDGSKTLTADARKVIADGLPARLFGMERLERAALNDRGLDQAFAAAFPKAMFALLPIFAMLTRMAWRRRIPWYPAHLYLALHVHAAWFGVLGLATLAGAAISSAIAAATVEAVAIVYLFWYALVTLRRVFGESWFRTTAKGAVVLVAYMLCLFPVSLLMLAYAITQV